jgi:hypothetical protein
MEELARLETKFAWPLDLELSTRLKRFDFGEVSLGQK